MQFVCGSCKAKYEIPAGRVKGRVLKIRCRECGTVIEIRGDAFAVGIAPEEKAGHGSGGKDAAAPALHSMLRERFKESFTSAPSPGEFREEAPGKREGKSTKADRLLDLAKKAEARAIEMKEPDRWYVGIKNSPVGPIGKSKIRSYIRGGEVTLSSLVWKEGFDDWRPLRVVSDLKKMFEEVMGEAGEARQIDVAARLQRAALSVAGGAVPPSALPLVERKRSEIARGNETDEVESLDDLIAQSTPGLPLPQDAKTRALIDDVLAGYYMGRIDAQGTLPGVESMRPSYAPDIFPAAVLPAKRRTLLARMLHSRLFLLAGGATALLVGFVVMVAVMNAIGGKEENAERKEAGLGRETGAGQAEERGHEEKKGEEEGVEEQGDILAGLVITVDEVMEAEEADRQPNEKSPGADYSRRKKSKAQETFKTEVMEMPDVEEHSVAMSSLKKEMTEKSAKEGGAGRNGLSDEEIKGAVIKQSKTIQRCYEKVLGRGMGVDEKIKVKVQVNVGMSGKVTRVKVIDVSKYGNFLTPCMENGIMGWVFPKADATSEFIFPILLTPKS